MWREDGRGLGTRLVGGAWEQVACRAHKVSNKLVSGPSLLWMPLGPKYLSWLARCPCFRGRTIERLNGVCVTMPVSFSKDVATPFQWMHGVWIVLFFTFSYKQPISWVPFLCPLTSMQSPETKSFCELLLWQSFCINTAAVFSSERSAQKQTTLVYTVT